MYTLGGDGVAISAPVVAADGTLFVLTDKGYLSALDRTGVSRWTFIAGAGDPYKFSPTLGADGSAYLAGEDKMVFAVNPDGSRRYQFATTSKILSQPVVATDGTLYVATEGGVLHAIEPNGTQRFRFAPAAGKFKTSPVLSADGATVYLATEGNLLLAVDAQRGVERWRYTMAGNLKSSPVLDEHGNIVVGSEGHDLVILNPQGNPISRLTLADKITQSASIGRDGTVSVRVGDREMVTLSRMPNQWDGRPDVEPTDLRRTWRLSNPIAIDVGADQLHERALPSGVKVTGQGIGIAVLDSGVYYNKKVRDILSADLDKHFLGQIDVVGDGLCTAGGEQFTGYCIVKSDRSTDPYGHGSHVAGIIWSKIVDEATGVAMGIAPDANILSVRVLGDNGDGSYADVIEGIQYVVAHKDAYNIRVMNLSLSARASTPYFVDPFDRAVERAWQAGIVVVAAAGNEGPGAETITVPGNDPYVITVGALNDQRTPGYWADDTLPKFTATGPTLDGFVKPDVLAPGAHIISFIYNLDKDGEKAALLARNHPDYASTMSLFRMNGTSMATAVTSAVVALMLQVYPRLTPDQVKYRLMRSAQPATTALGQDVVPVYNIFQQGAGRIWAPAAVFMDMPNEDANRGMSIENDLTHNFWESWRDGNGNGLVDVNEVNPEAISPHYQGAVQRLTSDDGRAYLYYTVDNNGKLFALGAAQTDTKVWLDRPTMDSMSLTWNGGSLLWPAGSVLSSGGYAWGGGGYAWSGGMATWAGGTTWPGGGYAWGGGGYAWGGGGYAWSGGGYAWSGGGYAWSGGGYAWSGGGYAWSGGGYAWGGGGYAWGGSLPWGQTNSLYTANAGATAWVNDDGSVERSTARALSFGIPVRPDAQAPATNVLYLSTLSR